MTNTMVIAEASPDTVDAVLAMFPSERAPQRTATSQPTAALDVELRKARRALLNVPADDYDTWVFVGMALHATFDEGAARAIWDEWSRKSAKYDPKTIEKHWHSFRGRQGGKTIAYVYWIAKQHEPNWRRDWRTTGATDEQIADEIRAASARSTKFVADRAATTSDASLAAGHDGDHEPLTDVTNARLLVARRGTRLRHCASLGWLEWNGSRWVRCSNDEQLQHAVEVIEAFYAEAVANLKQAVSAMKDAKLSNESDEAIKALQRRVRRLMRIQKHALATQQVSRLQAMLTIAASDPRITVDVTAFDADPWLLNCPNGTVDLRTGVLRAHREEDLLMQMAGASYDPNSDCPLWKQTLAEVFAGDDADEIGAYLQRAAGYSAIGIVREEVFLLLWGDGRNGKGTITETIQAALGTYAKAAPMSLFLEQRHDGSKKFTIASLQGARMLVASEAGEGKAFDLAVLKNWTGGDKRVGEFKYHDSFEYMPTDTPWLLVNDKPRVKSWDVAFEERVHLLPFTHSFTGNAVDKSRKARLRDELAGILAWIVRGSLEWARVGLCPPERVRAAVRDFRQESTRADEFVANHLMRVVGMTLRQSDVYPRYREWSRAHGYQIVPEQRFGTFIEQAGFGRHKTKYGQEIRDCAFRPEAPQGDDR